jgi:hypothetical protein
LRRLALEARRRSQNQQQPLRGEIGVLKSSRAIPGTRQCYIIIEYQGMKYVGCVFCNDDKFCSQLVSLLAHEQGGTIAEIGDLDLESPTDSPRHLRRLFGLTAAFARNAFVGTRNIR